MKQLGFASLVASKPCRERDLALQLFFPFEMSASGFGLVSAAP
jgi:hypothetical protein